MDSSTDTDGITARWELEGRPIRIREAETRVYLYHFIQTDAMRPPRTTPLFDRALAPALR